MPITFYYNNKSAIHITHELVQYGRTKHVEVDKHFIICTESHIYTHIPNTEISILPNLITQNPFDYGIVLIHFPNALLYNYDLLISYFHTPPQASE